MPATPTDRHRELAERIVDRIEATPFDDLDTVQIVAEGLAEADTRRVPLEAVGGAYQRGRREVIRAVRAKIAEPAPVESDVAFGMRLLRYLDELEATR